MIASGRVSNGRTRNESSSQTRVQAWLCTRAREFSGSAADYFRACAGPGELDRVRSGRKVISCRLGSCLAECYEAAAERMASYLKEGDTDLLFAYLLELAAVPKANTHPPTRSTGYAGGSWWPRGQATSVTTRWGPLLSDSARLPVRYRRWNRS